jgi:antitoxin HigA-1
MARIGSRMNPGQVLREEYMEPAHLDAAGLARLLDVPASRITLLLSDNGRLNSDLALRLARCFQTTPQFWLGLQISHDLAVAHEKFGAEINARVRPLAA